MAGTHARIPLHRLGRLPRRALQLLAGTSLVTATLIPLVGSPALADTNPGVTMTASAAQVAPGQSLTYTVTVNPGDDDLDGMKLTDQLNGLTSVVLTSTLGYCGISSNLLTCTAGEFPHNASPWVVTIRGTVTAASGTTLTNAATASAFDESQARQGIGNTQVLVSNASAVPLPDLSVALSGPSNATYNTATTWTLTVSNSGGAIANNIEVLDTLPQGFALTSAKGTNLFTCSAPPSGVITIDCTGGSVDVGQNATITIVATAPGTAGRYDSNAVVDPYNAIPEISDTNNTATQQVAVSSVAPPTGEKLTLVETAPAQIRFNDVITYTLKVSYLSTKDSADNVKVTDGVQGLDQASVTASTAPSTLQATCSVSASLVTCSNKGNNLQLKPGQSLTVTIGGRVVQPTGTILNNSSTVTANLHNPNGSQSRTATASTIVRPPVDLSITKFSTCASYSFAANPTGVWGNCPFRARDQFNDVITVGNSGLDDASNVLVREPLPADTIFEGADFTSPAAGSCSAASGVVSCTLTSVPGATSSGSYGGTIRQFVLHLTAPDSVGTITSTATVNPNNTITETNTANNTATSSAAILTGIDLTIEQAVNYLQIAPSGTLVYTITVSNIGTQDATGIKVSDVLPAGTRFRQAQGDGLHNWTCQYNNSTSGPGEVDCTGGQLKGKYAVSPSLPHTANTDTSTITVTLFAPPAFGATIGSLSNQISVDPDGTIAEILENNNINNQLSQVAIPTTPGSNGTFNELTISQVQASPTSSPGNPIPVVPNGTLVYTLTVGNVGTDPATNVTVADAIPQGTRFRSAVSSPLTGGSGGFACSFNAPSITCNNGALASNGTATITVTLFAPDAEGQIQNQAMIDPNNTIPEADETNDTSTLPTTVQLNGGGGAYNELGIGLQQEFPLSGGSVAPSGTLVYDVNVTNTGSDRATQVLVQDYLPSGTTFRKALVVNGPNGGPGSPPTGINGGFACSQSNGIVNCQNGTLQGGGTARIRIVLFAPGTTNGSQPPTVDNQAVIDPNNTIPEADESNNTADIETDVASSADGGAGAYQDLALGLTGAPDDINNPSNPALTSAQPDKPYTYTLTVNNLGTDDLQNAEVTDTLPAGSTFVSAKDTTPSTVTGNPFSCSVNNGVVDCTGATVRGTLAGGAARTIAVVVNEPHANGQVVDQAFADPNNKVSEANEGNNAASTLTDVESLIDLRIQFTASVPDQGNPGSMSGTFCNVAVTAPAGGWAADTDTPPTDCPGTPTGSGQEADNVVTVWNLPVGVTILDTQAPTGTSCTTNQNPVNQVTCTTQSLPTNTQQTVTFDVYNNTSCSENESAAIDPNNTIAESFDSNNNSQTSNSGGTC